MMQIDFYILGENSHRDINLMVCRLCEKALDQEMNVLIYTKSPTQARQLDELLWTFKANSFIAHKDQVNEPQADTSFFYPVLISSGTATDDTDVGEFQRVFARYKQLLINLTAETPAFFQQFKRIAEMVGNNNDEKEIARNRYRSYRQEGHTLNKYDL